MGIAGWGRGQGVLSLGMSLLWEGRCMCVVTSGNVSWSVTHRPCHPLWAARYEDWFITLYNVLYSSLPVLLMGLLGQVGSRCRQVCLHRLAFACIKAHISVSFLGFTSFWVSLLCFCCQATTIVLLVYRKEKICAWIESLTSLLSSFWTLRVFLVRYLTI